MNKFGLFLIILSAFVLVGAILFIINPIKRIGQYNDSKRIQDLKKISVALEEFKRDYGRYPKNSPEFYTIIPEEDQIPWGGRWEPYLSPLPKDPVSSRRYVYISDPDTDNKSYVLYASLEDPASQKDACSITGECAKVPGVNLCGANAPCNYGITSGNISP